MKQDKLTWRQRARYALLHFEFVIIAILAFGLVWFVHGITHPEAYAPPTRSVSWLGLVLVGVASLGYCLRNEYRVYLHCRILHLDGPNPKPGVFTPVALILAALAYIIIPTWGRHYVNNLGRYWAIEEDKGDGFKYQSDEVPGVIGEAFSSYPSWDFTCRAKDPFTPPDRIFVENGFPGYGEGGV